MTQREKPTGAAVTGPGGVWVGDSDVLYVQHRYHQVLVQWVSGCPFCPGATVTVTSPTPLEADHVR